MTKLYIASCAPLADPARFAALETGIPRARREKLAPIKNAGARRLSLGASLLLARALEDAGLPAGELAVTEHGKPYFPDAPDFHFSLSHSGDTALCAASTLPVGCDVELPRAYDARIAERFFHPDERAWLLRQPEAQQADAFFYLWTRKESFMKALGLGFSLPMDAFSVVPALRQSADPRPWTLRSLRDGERFIALCGLADVDAAPLITVDWGELNP